MNTTAMVRLALSLSVLSTVLVLLVLLSPGPRTDASAGSGAPALPLPGADDVGVLREELAELRDLVEDLDRSLRDAGERRALQPEDAPVATAAGTSEPAPPPAFDVREELLEGFGSLSGPDRVDALRELAELARWGDVEARALLLESLGDADAVVRARALRELGELADPALLERMPLLANDHDRRVREAAARALARCAGDEAGPLLLGLLGDEEDDVVLEALRSLDRLDYEPARPRARELLAAPDVDVAVRAAALLRALGEKQSAASVVARVLEHFARSDVSARVKDVKRLRTLRARAELRGILDTDPSSTVRFEAQKALASLED